MVDETADAKSSCNAAGAACQDSGTLGGIALCQVAVTLTLASGRGHALIDRALYLPPACAADDEHRELAGIPDEVSFATKPELADELNIIRFGNSQAVADGGLAWSADGSQLFAVLEYFDVNTGTFTFSLQVIDQPTLTRSILSLSGPSTADITKSVALTGNLALSTGVAPPAGTPITVTRSPAGSTPTKNFTVATAANGGFTVQDTPPTLGKYTYTVSYSGARRSRRPRPRTPCPLSGYLPR